MNGLQQHEAFLDEQDKLVTLDGNTLRFQVGEINALNVSELSSESEIINTVQSILFSLLPIKELHHNYLTSRILRLIKQASSLDIDIEQLKLRLYVDSFNYQSLSSGSQVLNFIPKSNRKAFYVTINAGEKLIQIRKPLWGYPDYFLTACVSDLAVKKLPNSLIILLPTKTDWQHDYIKPVKQSEAHQSFIIQLVCEGQECDQALEKLTAICEANSVAYTIT